MRRGLQRITGAALAGLGTLLLWAAAPAKSPHGGTPAMDKGVYSFTMKLNDGSEKPLSAYEGKVLLIVNTASECGFTPQYKGLEELFQKYREQGLEVLAFPANNFGSQEPGSDPEIRKFCTLKYHVSFPLFAKTSVKGSDINPLYRYLTSQSGFDGDITWNFNKFLVNRSGKVVARYDSKVEPMAPELVKEVRKLLDQKG